MRIFASGLRVFFGISARRFVRALLDPEAAQERLLTELLERLAKTRYGESHGIHGGEGYEGFRSRIPITDYDGLAPWIEMTRKRERFVLSPEPVTSFEKTSGSSGIAKYVPYTRSLKRSYQRMFLLWSYDLLCRAKLPLRHGRLFMSVSPSLVTEGKSDSVDGVPVGFEDDSEYLNPLLRWLMRRYLVIPTDLKKIRDAHEYQRVLAAYLLADPDLEVISVWSPSYLTALLDFIASNRSELRRDLKRGEIWTQGLRFRLPPSGRPRAALLAGALEWRLLWPRLRLISCWTDHTASLLAPRLRELFPGVPIQGKGLLSTEAPMTIPWGEGPGCVPLLDEVFFELETQSGELFRLHEAELGATYAVILTQKGGLTRYRMGDLVKVVGFEGRTPRLEFRGRASQVSDLVGEKLNEVFVVSELRELLADWVLAPEMTSVPGYRCWVDETVLACLRDRSPQAVAAEVERRLCRSYQYLHARRMGQLRPIEVVPVARLRSRCLEFFESKGLKRGDIKEQALIRDVAVANALREWLTA
jgi:hypothetical protein